jgi:hypothetical protein
MFSHMLPELKVDHRNNSKTVQVMSAEFRETLTDLYRPYMKRLRNVVKHLGVAWATQHWCGDYDESDDEHSDCGTWSEMPTVVLVGVSKTPARYLVLQFNDA